MAEFEKKLMNLFYFMINRNSKVNDWDEILLFAVRCDVELDTEFCSTFKKELITMINDKYFSQRNVLRKIYANLLHHCSQLQPTMKFVLDRILRNSRGYLKNEFEYANFTNRLLSMLSTEFWRKNDTWCYCNLDVCWQFFTLLSSFFEYDEDDSKSTISNNTESCYALGVTIEEERFWVRIIECKNVEQLENLFTFLQECFSAEILPISPFSIVECFCLCHKNVWLSQFAPNNDIDELDLENELIKLEERVLSRNKKMSDSNETGFQIPVIGQLIISQMAVDEIGLNEEESDDRKNLKEEFDEEENLSGTSEWSIELSEGINFKQKAKMAKETKEQLALIPTKNMKNPLTFKHFEQNSDVLSDDGKTESAIESIPYDEPIYEKYKIEFLSDLTHLKFDHDEENEQRADNADLINYVQENHTHFNQEDYKLLELESRANFVADQFIDEALSPLQFLNLTSTLMQTDDVPNSNESSSTTEIEGVQNTINSLDSIIGHDQSTQTLSAVINDFMVKPNEDHYLHIETIDSVEIQNIFKLAQTFSTIC